MKKVTSLLLALVMALALAVPAFAAEPVVEKWPGPEDTRKDVTAQVDVIADETVNTYHVTVTWKVPQFSYTFAGTKYTWNTTDLKYTTAPNGTDGWANNGQGTLELKVVNRSDMAVNCTAKLDADTTTHKNLTMTCWDNSNTVTKTADAVITIGADETEANYTNPDENRTAKECDLSGTITVGGEPNKAKGATTLGTITLTLTK